ncbi:MAG: PAS domain-containing protein [Verrucomicrobia bacterium]|nr:PAS domain-containing protein [Verrucomicrobiota bacterium]
MILAVLTVFVEIVPGRAQGLQFPTKSPSKFLTKSWEIEDGLPDNSVTAVVQGPDGYLWFGTFNGLVRFNGTEFATLNPANTPMLPSAGIVNLHLDQRARLWISTYQGLVLRDGDQWQHLHSDQGWRGDYARSFAERSNGDILITGFNGKLFEFNNGKFSELPPPPGEPGQGYQGGVDEDGHWWVVQNQFVGRWEKDQWIRMLNLPNLSRESVGIAPARGGGLWLILGKELRKIQKGREVSRIELSEPPGGVWSMFEDSAHHIWISTFDQGVCQVLPDGTLIRWNSSNGGVNQTRCIFEDRERNLWLGTSGSGLVRLVPRRFQSLPLDSESRPRSVQSISLDSQGDLWAGTFGDGLFRLNEAGPKPVNLPQVIRDQRYLKSVLADRSGRLWVGTTDSAVWRMDPDGPRHLPAQDTGGHNIHALFEDSRGRIWISGGSGVAVSDGETSTRFGRENGLPRGTVTCFAEDPAGLIWMANAEGVFRTEGPAAVVEVKDAAHHAIPNIRCLYSDAAGAVWMGSADRGLLRWHQGTLKVLGLESGFPAPAIHGLIEDWEGNFWITSSSHLFRVSRRDLEALADGRISRPPFQMFDAGDGLPGGEFSQNRQPNCALDGQGCLWFALSKGVGMTQPSTWNLNPTPPPVHVEEISYFEPTPPRRETGSPRTQPEGPPIRVRAPFSAPVTLPPGSQRIEVHYVGLSLGAPEKVAYQIRLDGHDGDWIDVGNRRVAYYHDLPPNTYAFHVRAANPDGVWNESGTVVALTILPYYWQTAWFRLLTALGFAGSGAALVWMFARRKLHLQQEELAHQRALSGLEQRVNLAARAANLGIWERNLVTQEVWASDAWRHLFGLDSQVRLDLEKVLERIHPEDRESARQVLGRVVQDPTANDTEFRIVFPGGETRWIASRGLVEVDEADRPVLMRGVSLDITDRKRTEQALREQQSELAHLSRATLLGELGGALAHELNQPLTAMVNNAAAGRRFIAKGRGDLQKLDGLLEEVSADGRRAGEILQGIRAMIRRGDDERRPFDLNAAAAEILKLAGPDALGRQCSLIAEFDSSLTPVNGNRVQIQQVFLNLILNALDAVDQGPPEFRRIIVRTQRGSDSRVEVSVRDFGGGLPKEDPNRVFKPFFTNKRNGMGLGLAIARSIVEGHGGRITASNAEGGGACFAFWLPDEASPGTENPRPLAANGGLIP